MHRLIGATVIALALVAGCGSSGDDSSAEDPIGVDAGDLADEDELESVFPLPSAEVTELFPYSIIDDDSVRAETATFLVVGPSVEAIVDFYDSLLTNMGYVVGDPVPVGESVTLDITDPSNPAMTAVIQAGPVEADEPTVQLNQERTELKE